MAKVITYDAPSNTIEADGGTAVDPITPQNIYDADIAGGWGVSTKISGYRCRDLFAFECRVRWGANATTCWRMDTIMVWAHCTDFNAGRVTWVSQDNGSIESDYQWSGGNSYKSVLSGSGTVESFTFSHDWNVMHFSGIARACTFRGGAHFLYGGATWEDCLFLGQCSVYTTGHTLRRPNVSILYNQTAGLLTVEEPFVRDGGRLATYFVGSHLEVVDPHYAGSFTVLNGHDGAWIKEQWSVYGHVTDANGDDDSSASVKLVDEGDESTTFDVNCDANGETGQQIVTRKKWEDTSETLTEYGPWRAEITFGDGVVLKIPHILLDEQLGSADQPWEVHHPDHAAEADVEAAVVYADESLTGTYVGEATLIAGEVSLPDITGTVELPEITGEVT